MKNENGEGAGISFVIMPVEILQDKNLTSSEKVLYCYLSLFKKGVCFQSNAKLAEMTGLDESTIKRGLRKLGKMQYVFVEFVNNNSAARRIYTILENPKKLAYLTRTGMFNLDRKSEVVRTSMSGPKPIAKPEPPVADTPRPLARPKKADFASAEEYEKAFYKWNNRIYN